MLTNFNANEIGVLHLCRNLDIPFQIQPYHNNKVCGDAVALCTQQFSFNMKETKERLQCFRIQRLQKI